MNIQKLLKRLSLKRLYFVNAILVFFLFVLIASTTGSNFTFPHSSYSNLGNPMNNRLYMFFNIGLISSVILLSIYFRYITIKLFKHSEIFRISYIIPILSVVFIGLFPQQGDLKFHGFAIIGNLVLLTVLTPINIVGLYRKRARLLKQLALVTFLFLIPIVLSLVLIPFDTKHLGVLETVIIIFIAVVCLTVDRSLFKTKLFSGKRRSKKD
jgi:hypothetical membrane protein